MADMVPHEIEPAKGVGGAPHDVAREGVLAQIADDAERPAARGGDLPHDGIDPGLIDVDHPDRRALAREAQRAGPPHPRSRRRDDADLVLQAHGVTSQKSNALTQRTRRIRGGREGDLTGAKRRGLQSTPGY